MSLSVCIHSTNPIGSLSSPKTKVKIYIWCHIDWEISDAPEKMAFYLYFRFFFFLFLSIYIYWWSILFIYFDSLNAHKLQTMATASAERNWFYCNSICLPVLYSTLLFFGLKAFSVDLIVGLWVVSLNNQVNSISHQTKFLICLFSLSLSFMFDVSHRRLIAIQFYFWSVRCQSQ